MLTFRTSNRLEFYVFQGQWKCQERPIIRAHYLWYSMDRRRSTKENQEWLIFRTVDMPRFSSIVAQPQCILPLPVLCDATLWFVRLRIMSLISSHQTAGLLWENTCRTALVFLLSTTRLVMGTRWTIKTHIRNTLSNPTRLSSSQGQRNKHYFKGICNNAPHNTYS